MKVHQAVARCLVDNGIDALFGLIGDANLYLVDAYSRDCGGTYVAASHEGAAVLMAIGHASATGRIGAATVTHGPALTNTLTALVEAARARLPLLLLCGDTAVIDQDHLQNIAQRELILATGAGFQQMRSAQTCLDDLLSAMRAAILERRPVAFNMPADLQWSETQYRKRCVSLPSARSLVPMSEDVENAIGVIAAARRPIVLAGRGAVDAHSREALIRLADRIEAPLATSLKAKDLFRGHPFNMGVFGTQSEPPAVDLILESDCIIAVGCGLNIFTTANRAYTKGKRIVHCHAQASEIGRHVEVDAGLVGDPVLTIENIIHWLDEADVPGSGFRTPQVEQALSEYVLPPRLHDVRGLGTVDIRNALVRLNDALPQNRVLVSDGGRFQGEVWRAIDAVDPQSFVYTINFGSIGMGMSEAIGAAVAFPDRPVVMACGDGGYMLGGLTEFHTAVRNRLDMIVIICNDGGYGAEHVQLRNKDMDPSLTLLDWPDFASVAQAMGGTGIRVSSEAELLQAIALIASRDRPLLIDLRLDPDRIPDVTYA